MKYVHTHTLHLTSLKRYKVGVDGVWGGQTMSVRHIMNLFYVWYSYKATSKLPWYHWILIRNIIVPYLSQNFLHFPPQGPDCNNDHYGTKCELELPSNNNPPRLLCHVQISKENTFKRKKCPRDVASNYQRSTASDIGAALTQFTGWSTWPGQGQFLIIE